MKTFYIGVLAVGAIFTSALTYAGGQHIAGPQRPLKSEATETLNMCQRSNAAAPFTRVN